jgi:hypothetical protein
MCYMTGHVIVTMTVTVTVTGIGVVRSVTVVAAAVEVSGSAAPPGALRAEQTGDCHKLMTHAHVIIH